MDKQPFLVFLGHKISLIGIIIALGSIYWIMQEYSPFTLLTLFSGLLNVLAGYLLVRQVRKLKGGRK